MGAFFLCGLVLGRIMDQSHCRKLVGDSKVTDLDFANDAIIFVGKVVVILRHNMRKIS